MIWNQCCEQNIAHPDPINYDWMKENLLRPCWFEGSQLPPSLLREKNKRNRKETDQGQGYDADMNKSEVEEPTQKRLRRNSLTQTRPVSNGSEADVLESIEDTGHTSSLIITADGESDVFDEDDIYLSSLSGSDEDEY